MNCANHTEVTASQFCRVCGKPLCASCARDVQGVTYCEQCLAQRLGEVHPPQAAYQPVGTVGTTATLPPPISGGGPNPALAGILAGFFPFGVGAVYTGQYAKGLGHLVTMTLLIWGETVVNNDGLNAVLGVGIAFFYVYQIIDAVKSAHAIRAGLPAPDPFGMGAMFGGWESKAAAGAATSAAFTPAPGVGTPPMYQPQPTQAQRIPTAAILLIALGCLFLFRTTGLFDFDADFVLPLVLIGIGAFILVRRKNAPAGAIDKWGRPMRRSLIGSVVLITLGVLFLVGRMHGPGFDRTWPLLLLAIGAVKLLEVKNPAGWNAGPVAPLQNPPTGEVNPTSSDEVNRG